MTDKNKRERRQLIFSFYLTVMSVMRRRLAVFHALSLSLSLSLSHTRARARAHCCRYI